MKFLKWFFLLLGLAALIGAGVLLGRVWVDIGRLMSAVRAYNTGVKDPWQMIAVSAGISALGGLLLGWGIGLPSRSSRAVRAAYREELEARGIQIERN